MVEVRNCPGCGHKNKPDTEECAYCGADIRRVPVAKELVTMPAVTEAANRPPPPPPSKEQLKKAESSARFAGWLRSIKDYVITLAVGVGGVFLLYAISNKEPGRAPEAQAVSAETGPAALDVFYAYKIRKGEEKGKTMRQFWAEYLQLYEMSRAKGKPGMELQMFSQRAPAGGDRHNVFVMEAVAGERRRAFPFSVDAASLEVVALAVCDFGPGTPAEYSVAVCEGSADLFPEGI